MKVTLLEALVRATDRMTRAIAAIAADDFTTAEQELVEVRRIIAEQSEELRAA